jgi:hypothetical protein
VALVQFGAQIKGTKQAPTGRSYLFEEQARIGAGRCVRNYESHEFVIPTPQASTSIRTIVTHSSGCSCARVSGAFGVIARANRVSIRNNGNGAVIVRYNDQTADPFTIDSGENHDFNVVECEDIFLANTSGIATAVRVTMA